MGIVGYSQFLVQVRQSFVIIMMIVQANIAIAIEGMHSYIHGKWQMAHHTHVKKMSIAQYHNCAISNQHPNQFMGP